MKKRTYLYIPLILLFILSMTALVQHGNRVFLMLSRTINQSGSVRVPFEIQRGKIVYVLPEASEAGIQVGDTLAAVNGKTFDDGMLFYEELGRSRVGEKVNYTVKRSGEDGAIVRHEAAVTGQPMNQTFRQWFPDFLISFIFLLLLPVASFLLGFYVAFMRPRDPLAWILLFLMLGIGSIALEGGRQNSLPKVFQESAINLLGIWMILFGIYFPERLHYDRRFPFVKWLLIVPLAVIGGFNLFEQIGRFFGWRWLWESIDNLTKPFDRFSVIFTMLGIGLFLASMAIKSSTL